MIIKKKIKSLNESQNIKEIPITANIEQLLSVSKLNDYQNQLFKKYYKNIFNDMINYIYDYYHKDYISVEDKSLITKDNIKKNWVIYTISLQYDDYDKNEFGISISSDWNKKFLNTEYKKIHDDHILSVCAMFRDNKYIGSELMFDG